MLQSLGSSVSVLPLSILSRFTPKDLNNTLSSFRQAKWSPAQAKTLVQKLLENATVWFSAQLIRTVFCFLIYPFIVFTRMFSFVEYKWWEAAVSGFDGERGGQCRPKEYEGRRSAGKWSPENYEWEDVLPTKNSITGSGRFVQKEMENIRRKKLLLRPNLGLLSFLTLLFNPG